MRCAEAKDKYSAVQLGEIDAARMRCAEAKVDTEHSTDAYEDAARMRCAEAKDSEVFIDLSRRKMQLV